VAKLTNNEPYHSASCLSAKAKHDKGAGLGRLAKLAQKTTTQKRQKHAEPLAQTKAGILRG